MSQGYQAAAERNTAGRAAEMAGGRGESLAQGRDVHDNLVCGARGAPACGSWQTRDASLTPADQGMKRATIDFLNAQSPDPAFAGQTVGAVTVSRAGTIEHQAWMIEGPSGKVRLSPIIPGDADTVQNIRLPELKDGESIVGVVHAHPGRGATEFSVMDGRAAARWSGSIRTLRASIVVAADAQVDVFRVIVHDFTRGRQGIYHYPVGKW